MRACPPPLPLCNRREGRGRPWGAGEARLGHLPGAERAQGHGPDPTTPALPFSAPLGCVGEATGFRERAKALISGSAPGLWFRGLREGGGQGSGGAPARLQSGRCLLRGHSPVLRIAISEAFGEWVAGDLELRDLRGGGRGIEQVAGAPALGVGAPGEGSLEELP